MCGSCADRVRLAAWPGRGLAAGISRHTSYRTTRGPGPLLVAAKAGLPGGPSPALPGPQRSSIFSSIARRTSEPHNAACLRIGATHLIGKHSILSQPEVNQKIRFYVNSLTSGVRGPGISPVYLPAAVRSGRTRMRTTSRGYLRRGTGILPVCPTGVPPVEMPGNRAGTALPRMGGTPMPRRRGVLIHVLGHPGRAGWRP